MCSLSPIGYVKSAEIDISSEIFMIFRKRKTQHDTATYAKVQCCSSSFLPHSGRGSFERLSLVQRQQLKESCLEWYLR